MLSVTNRLLMLSVIMLNVIIPSVVMQNAVAPWLSMPLRDRRKNCRNQCDQKVVTNFAQFDDKVAKISLSKLNL